MRQNLLWNLIIKASSFFAVVFLLLGAGAIGSAHLGWSKLESTGVLTVVFGAAVHTAGVYSQTFSAASGCDSVHTVTVTLLTASVPTAESRVLCPGDSTLVFGAYVSAPGTYTAHFQNTYGCDSTHSIALSLLSPSAPTQELVQICPGDTATVFGSAVHAAGTYSQTFVNAAGCDSVHTVVVSLYAPPTPTMAFMIRILLTGFRSCTTWRGGTTSGRLIRPPSAN